MKPRYDIPSYSVYIVLGTAVTLALVMAVLHFNASGRLSEEALAKVRALQLVDHMRLDLALASQKEWSAVMAETGQDSRAFADQARSAVASAGELGRELKAAMEPYLTHKDKDLLAGFFKAFEEYRAVDADLLHLAVQRTNTKAYDLAFGPAGQSLQDMFDALTGLTGLPGPGGPDTPVAPEALRLAFQAEVGALRIQALLAPHIAEAQDEEMDRMESRMSREDQAVRDALDGLDRLAGMNAGGQARVIALAAASARAAYGRFSAIRADILRLSRENTNVRSIGMAMDRKKTVDAQCQDILETVRQAIAQSMPGEMVKTKGTVFSK